MNSTENLKDILKGELDCGKELLKLLQQEKEFLIDCDLTGIERLAKQKDTVVLKLKLYEEERKRIIKQINRKCNNRDYHIFELDKELKKILSELKSLFQSIYELNEGNRLLITRSLDYLTQLTGFLYSCGITERKNLLSREA